MSRFTRGTNIQSPERLDRLKQRRQARQLAARKKLQSRLKTLFLKALKVLTVLALLALLISSLWIARVDSSYRSDFMYSYFEDNPSQKIKLFFNADDFKRFVLSDPALANLEVRVGLLGRSVAVEPIMRQHSITLKASNGDFAVSDDGIIFSKELSNPGAIIFVDDSDLDYEIGDKVFNSSTTEAVYHISQIEGIKHIGFFEESAIFLKARVGEVDLLFTLAKPLDTQIAKYREVAGEISANSYIDLRVDDKVLYR